MSTAQKDPIQFIANEDRHDHARKHQMIFPRSFYPDLEVVACKGMQFLEGLEARLYLNLYDIMGRKVAAIVAKEKKEVF